MPYAPTDVPTANTTSNHRLVAFCSAIGGIWLGLVGCQPELCVAEGSEVLTPGGSTAIERLQLGDTIPCVDVATGALIETTVTAIRQSQRECMVLEVGGGRLECTPDHPLWSPERCCYTEAGEWITGGLKLLSIVADGTVLRREVKRTSVYSANRRVFDISVASEHANFVAGGVVVHNKACPASTCGESATTGATKGTTGPTTAGETEATGGTTESTSTTDTEGTEGTTEATEAGSSTTDAGSSTTEADTAGSLEPGRAENSCSWDDGPAVAFVFGIEAGPVCTAERDPAGWLRVLIMQDGPLSPDVYSLGDIMGLANYDSGDGEVQFSDIGTLTVDVWDDDGVSGSYAINFGEDVLLSASFSVEFCDSDSLCGE